MTTSLLYEDMGPECLEHLRGRFSFVIWDEDEKTLFAARDRFGLKSLFYHESNGILYLASEAKALLAAGVARGSDTSGVPPGHMLVSTPESTRLMCYL